MGILILCSYAKDTILFMFLIQKFKKRKKKGIQNKNRRKLEKENQKEKEKNTHLLEYMKTLSEVMIHQIIRK